MANTSDGAPRPNTNNELRSFIERIENLQAEQKELGEDIRSVKAEAKAAGFDGKVIAEMLKLRRMEPADRSNWEALRTTYGSALGIFG